MRPLRSRALYAAPRAPCALAASVALYLMGCGGAPRPSPMSSADPRRGSEAGESEQLPVRGLRVNPAGEPIELECDYGKFEECNALDDDCNGIIDDGCDYESGEVQVTIGWNTGADIDLYVTDPSGATLYYNKHHKRSKIGGHLDHDARGDCRREQRNSRIENAYWPAPARSGSYRVELHYFSPCARGATTEVTVSVVVDRHVLGAYRFDLEPEERIEALRFVKP